MPAHADKTEKAKTQKVAHRTVGPQSSPQGPVAFVDNRPVAAAQRQQQEMINTSAQVQEAAQLQAQISQSPTMQPPLQLRAVEAAAPAAQQPKNTTGLPDALKAGVENLSGYSLDDVHVHYNSAKPAQLQAHAYAQGTDIHVAPGQEQHLPHEAWHVVQQKQGRVRATKQLKGKIGVNDDAGLEKEADVMGAKALLPPASGRGNGQSPHHSFFTPSVIQGLFYEYVNGGPNKYHWGPVIEYIWAPKLDDNGHQEMAEDGTGIWLRKSSREYVEQILAQDVRIRSLHQEFRDAIAAININVQNRDEVIAALHTTHEISSRYLSELKATLKRHAILTMLGLGATVGVIVIADHFLSLPKVPWGLKAAIDIAGVLYGAYISVRWLESTILPELTSLLMAGANTALWLATLYPLLTEIADGHAFASVHVAALPLAISLEVLMKKLSAKVREMGERARENQPLAPQDQGGAYHAIV
jgi:hypothetical protein